MKISKYNMKLSIVSIVILLVSLLITLLDAFVSGFDLFASFKFHEILTFLFCLFIGFGCLNIYVFFSKKSIFALFICAILVGLAFIYAFSFLVTEYWWISLIVVATVWAILGVISFMVKGSITESIAENDNPDYKTYAQRKENSSEK